MITDFYKVSAVSPEIVVADIQYNLRNAKLFFAKEAEHGSSIVVFPELYLTGYTCGDLFLQQTLLLEAEKALIDFADFTKEYSAVAVIGLPLKIGAALYNCAAVIKRGRILGIVPKKYIPNYNECYQKRWFRSGFDISDTSIGIKGRIVPFGNLLFALSEDAVLGIEICEDLWAPLSSSTELCLKGANIIANLSASNETLTKNEYRKKLIEITSAKNYCAYIYANAGIGESTQDLVFSGGCLIADNGSIISESKRFEVGGSIARGIVDVQRTQSERIRNGIFSDNEIAVNQEYRVVSIPTAPVSDEYNDKDFYPYPFIPTDFEEREKRCEEILLMQSYAIIKRMRHIHCKKIILGLSGGLDSTLAFIAAIRALDELNLPHENLIAVTMPGFGTTGRTYTNAVSLIKAFSASFREISIKKSCLMHFNDIGQDENVYDITYENSQARERTQILMDLANKENALLIGTGDLSELALGWCTFNADHMSMYGINCSVPKTLIRYIISYEEKKSDSIISAILKDILETPVSPELLPPDENGDIMQKTEEKLGPYELFDFFIYWFIRFGKTRETLIFMASRAFSVKYSKTEIERYIDIFFKRFFANQFKRSCLPDGPKIGSVSLSPRGDLRMPSDASYNCFV